MRDDIYMKERSYIAIDLKSFYASVECKERGLDPLDTNLVVADESRTDKTICLAVTPSLKSYGIPGRPRLFEVKQKLEDANRKRKIKLKGQAYKGTSFLFSELEEDETLAIDFIIAKPRMAYYMAYSTKIYEVYKKYISAEDIIVYSIDEVFMDVTDYLNTYGTSAHDLAMKIILDVLRSTGITATAGIGTNLYLAKVAMDIVAKHIPADENGVRIATLDEMSYRKTLWAHEPLTDFWRIGKGIAKKLQENWLFTMGDIARCSINNEDLLYKLFGKNAELIIDHAWGYEPCTIKDIKAYKPQRNSLGSGQVLRMPYNKEKARIVIKEMADSLALDLVDKDLVENIPDYRNRTFYTCRYLTGNLCSRYNDRLDVCKRFPSSPWAVVPPECGYHNWLLEERKNVINHVKSLKEEQLKYKRMLNTNPASKDKLEKLIEKIDMIIKIYAPYGSEKW